MKCLILVDLQYDFMPGGALAVNDGDQVVPVANRLMPHFDLVVATKDWHPANHKSFASQHEGMSVGDVVQLDGLDQILWPDHCIEGTRGAELHHDIDVSRIQHVVQKGTNPDIDSYSGFFDNDHRQSTGLADWLRERSVTEAAVLGLATDYCVKHTALDAIQLGFQTTLISDGCRGVDLSPGDVANAIEDVRSAGGQTVLSDELHSKTHT